jgi:3-mercaptopropionate dioxygenase
MAAYGLAEFVADLDRIVADGGDDAARIPDQAKSLLERLISDVSWRPAARDLLPPPGRPRRFLHVDPERRYSISLMTFAPGQVTPVHDHNTWGLVGVWEGEEREDRFVRPDGAGPAGLLLDRALVNRAGTVTLLIPPDDDIHRIVNSSQVPAHSIHIYGDPIGGRSAQTYDLVTGATARWEDDPLGVMQAWGDHVDLRTLLRRPDADDAALLELVRERLRISGPMPGTRGGLPRTHDGQGV